jgi:hypothetical protein
LLSLLPGGVDEADALAGIQQADFGRFVFSERAPALVRRPSRAIARTRLRRGKGSERAEERYKHAEKQGSEPHIAPGSSLPEGKVLAVPGVADVLPNDDLSFGTGGFRE